MQIICATLNSLKSRKTRKKIFSINFNAVGREFTKNILSQILLWVFNEKYHTILLVVIICINYAHGCPRKNAGLLKKKFEIKNLKQNFNTVGRELQKIFFHRFFLMVIQRKISYYIIDSSNLHKLRTR